MVIQNGEIKDSLVVCQSNQGGEIRGSLLRMTRFSVAFEVYSPASVLRLSEVLSEFRIIAAGPHPILGPSGGRQPGQCRPYLGL